jgi:hypothetical protein
MEARAAEEAPVTVTATAAKAEVTVGEGFTVELEAIGPEGTSYTFPAGAEAENAELVSGAALAAAPAGGPASMATAPGGLATAPASDATAPASDASAPASDATAPAADATAPASDATAPAEAVSGPAGSSSTDVLLPNRYRYEARVFGLGDVTLPSLVVRYRLADGTVGEATASGPKVKVISLLPKDDPQQSIADIRGPVGMAIAPIFWVALGVALVVVGLAGFLLWRRLHRRPVEAAPLPVPELDAAAEARQALDRLALAGHFGRGDGRGFYIALTAIAKRYLERRLEAPVVEMTTAEMLALLRDSPHANDLHATMRDLAPAADQVKFAKGEAMREEGDRHLAAVRELVNRLEARLAPKPEEGKAA